MTGLLAVPLLAAMLSGCGESATVKALNKMASSCPAPERECSVDGNTIIMNVKMDSVSSDNKIAKYGAAMMWQLIADQYEVNDFTVRYVITDREGNITEGEVSNAQEAAKGRDTVREELREGYTGIE